MSDQVVAPPGKPTRRFLDGWGAVGQADPFRPLEPEVRIVQFGGPLGEADLARAGALIAGRPDVRLRVYPPSSPDLGFLKHFPGLRHLDIDIFDLEGVEGLTHVRDSLESFHLGATRRTIPLGFLVDLPRLRSLHLGGHKKGVAVLSRLVGLTELSLRGLTFPDLTPLLPLTRLRGLSLAMGRARDLGALPRFAELEALNLLRVTGLSDLSMLAEVAALRSLTLDWMQNVTSLPSFASLRRLETMSMETMKGLTSLASIAAAPALQTLEIVNMRQLKATDFACLIGHPSLRELRAFPGGARIHAEIKAMFPGVAR